MKQRTESTKGIVKGGYRGIIIAILIHVGIFLLAGVLVVFTVVLKQVETFEAPPTVERPPRQLKKPMPRVKKTSRPSARQRIVSQSPQLDNNLISLPALGGLGDGLGGDGLGSDGFLDVDILEVPTVFGEKVSYGCDLVGTFYDLNRRSNGRDQPIDRGQYKDILERFMRGGWKKATLAPYHASPRKLYATSILVPTMRSANAPMAFGEDSPGYCWVIVYEGVLVYPRDITFRFRGFADDILVVRVNGEHVLQANYSDDFLSYPTDANGVSSDHRALQLGSGYAAVGKWITLKANEPQPIQVMIGEEPGGTFCGMLLVEEKDVKYENTDAGRPIYPAFKTAPLTWAQKDAIYLHLVRGEADLDSGPYFNDLTPIDEEKRAAKSETDGPPAVAETSVEEADDPYAEGMRTWTLDGTETIDGEYVSMSGFDTILRTRDGKHTKVRTERLSPEDIAYIEITNPPEFKVDFAEQMSQREVAGSPHMSSPAGISVLGYVGSARVKKYGIRPYNQELRIDMYVFSKQMLTKSDIYQLSDRASMTFTPSRANDFSARLEGHYFEVATWEQYYWGGVRLNRGLRFYGYLITVTDKRGEIIAHSSTGKWLFQNVDKIRQLPVGAFLNQDCERIHPEGPPRLY